MADASTFIDEWYEIFYRPAKHPGDDHRTTCAEYRCQINNLNRQVQFPWWCERFDNPARGIPIAQLYRDFHVWLRRCGEPAEKYEGSMVDALRQQLRAPALTPVPSPLEQRDRV